MYLSINCLPKNSVHVILISLPASCSVPGLTFFNLSGPKPKLSLVNALNPNRPNTAPVTALPNLDEKGSVKLIIGASSSTLKPYRPPAAEVAPCPVANF